MAFSLSKYTTKDFFCGSDCNMTYMDYEVDWFDNCDSDTWSVLWIDDFLKQLGYDRVVDKHDVYWCQPGKSVADGLKEIKCDADILLMISATIEHNNLLLIIDHGGTLQTLTTDDVLLDGAPELPQDHFSTLYLSIDACKRGFLAGCRPVIFLDGCHIKTRYKGNLLTAVAIDPNDCIFPIAFGLCEVECTSSWEWFLASLKDDLNICNTSPYTIMSDKQKVSGCFFLFSVLIELISACIVLTVLVIFSGSNSCSAKGFSRCREQILC